MSIEYLYFKVERSNKILFSPVFIFLDINNIIKFNTEKLDFSVLLFIFTQFIKIEFVQILATLIYPIEHR